MATVLILLVIARTSLSLKTLGLLSYTCIFVGGVLTALNASPAVYMLGFLLVVGFDKMFSIYIRRRRQKIIPAADLGKTAGVIVWLNNLSQPVAGLAVGLLGAAAVCMAFWLMRQAWAGSVPRR